jgi:hypothetical protein
MKYTKILVVDFTQFAAAIKPLGLYWLILSHKSPES